QGLPAATRKAPGKQTETSGRRRLVIANQGRRDVPSWIRQNPGTRSREDEIIGRNLRICRDADFVRLPSRILDYASLAPGRRWSNYSQIAARPKKRHVFWNAEDGVQVSSNEPYAPFIAKNGDPHVSTGTI